MEQGPKAVSFKKFGGLCTSPLIAILPSGAARPAPAQPSADQSPPRRRREDSSTQNFDQVDVNNDGFLSRDEVADMTGPRPSSRLDLAEIEQEFTSSTRTRTASSASPSSSAAAKAKLPATPTIALQRLDSNKDGKVSPAEFNARRRSPLRQVDANKDGKVTPEERPRRPAAASASAAARA